MTPMKLEDWLSRMQSFKTDTVGNAATIHVARGGRALGWVFSINEKTDIAELVDHIDGACRDSGFAGPYELTALDANGNLCGPFKYTAAVTEIMSTSSSAAMIPHVVEGSLETGLNTQTAMTGLALKGVAWSQKTAERMMDRLEKENARLLKHNQELQAKVQSHWDEIEKLNTHQLETAHEIERVKRMGNLAETAVTALMAKLTGKGAPESSIIDLKLAAGLFRSIAASPERMAKIIDLLGDDERMALFELSSRFNGNGEPDGPVIAEKTNGLAAASAAAVTNGKGN